MVVENLKKRKVGLQTYTHTHTHVLEKIDMWSDMDGQVLNKIPISRCIFT